MIDTWAQARTVLRTMKFGKQTRGAIMEAIRFVGSHDGGRITKEDMQDALRFVAENCELKPIEPQTADEFQIVTVGSTVELADARLQYMMKQDPELIQFFAREASRRLEEQIHREKLFTAWMAKDTIRAEIKVVKPDKGGWLDNREDAMPDTREDW